MTVTPSPTHTLLDYPSHPASAKLTAGLLSQAQSLSFHAFEHLVSDLLERMGYQDVTFLGRTHPRQRTRHGGAELMASAQTGVTAARVVVQVKQYARPVSRRFIDELRGVMLRLQSSQAIIVTTATFAQPAQRAAVRHPLLPVRLVDGAELGHLLTQYDLGVRKSRRGKPVLDRPYFRSLRRRFPGTASTAIMQRHTPSVASQDALSTSTPNSPTMLYRTHLAAGIASLWLLKPIPGAITAQSIAPLAIVAALGSLLPDLDAARSRLSTLEIAGIRPFAPFSVRLHADFGHRGLMHSLGSIAVIGLAAVLASFWWGWVLSAALVLGWTSHLLADSATRTGIPGAPLTRTRLHLLPAKWRLVTGSADEELVFTLLSLAAFTLVLLELHTR
jgi:membrane-bound metal-dependent hydrolase YbcI (DUF457 family)